MTCQPLYWPTLMWPCLHEIPLQRYWIWLQQFFFIIVIKNLHFSCYVVAPSESNIDIIEGCKDSRERAIFCYVMQLPNFVWNSNKKIPIFLIEKFFKKGSLKIHEPYHEICITLTMYTVLAWLEPAVLVYYNLGIFWARFYLVKSAVY